MMTGKRLIISALVFTITVKHPDAARSAEIANTIAAVYLDKANKSRSENTLKASLSLQVQAEDLRKQLLETEDRIETFRIENGLISTGESATSNYRTSASSW